MVSASALARLALALANPSMAAIPALGVLALRRLRQGLHLGLFASLASMGFAATEVVLQRGRRVSPRVQHGDDDAQHIPARGQAVTIAEFTIVLLAVSFAAIILGYLYWLYWNLSEPYR
jgi:hypothetical protein